MTSIGFYALVVFGFTGCFGLVVLALLRVSEQKGSAAQKYLDDEEKIKALKVQAQDLADAPQSDDDFLKRLRDRDANKPD